MKEKQPTALQTIRELGRKVATMTQAELSRAVGVSRERIRQLVPRLKVKPGRRVRAWHRTQPRPQCNEMARLHDKGESLAAIGKKFGVSDYHVREAIRTVRPKLDPAGRIQRIQRLDLLRRLLDRGLGFEQACDKLGYSPLQRRRYRKQLGLRWDGRKTVSSRKRN